MVKKAIVKILNKYIEKTMYKLESLFGKETTTEQELFQLVKLIHQASCNLRELKQNNNYTYTVKNGKVYYVLPNNKRQYICMEDDIPDI